MTATLAELLGAEQPSTWDGQSFAGELSEKTNHGRDFVILSQGAWSYQRSIVVSLDYDSYLPYWSKGVSRVHAVQY